MKTSIKQLLLIVTIFTVTLGCRKFVNVPPPTTQLVGASVYGTNSTAAAAVTGIYETMVGNSIGGNQSGISSLLGLSSDELRLFPTSTSNVNEAYTNSLLSSLDIPIWRELYNTIYQSNLAIEGITASAGVTPTIKAQLIGEVKFVRAFCNFYLVQIYGDVPLVTTPDYKANSLILRTPQALVYDQIVADLKDAQSLLSDAYLTFDGSNASTRVRPNKGAATALLARVYLYLQKWDLAEAQSTVIINSANYQLSSDLNRVFLSTNNKEAIWQLEPPNNGFNTLDGSNFLGGYTGTSVPRATAPLLLSDTLVKYFETGDNRKTNWVVSKTVGSIVYYFPYKYKLGFTGAAPTEYTTVLRLAEQFLIRAEARAQLGNLSGAITDLNMIRNRAGLSNTTASSQQQLLATILQERRFELFTEYGHRWFDLKRTTNINTYMNVITPQKGGSWEPTDQLYPIPLTEIQRNPNLTQNPGYQ